MRKYGSDFDNYGRHGPPDDSFEDFDPADSYQPGFDDELTDIPSYEQARTGRFSRRDRASYREETDISELPDMPDMPESYDYSSKPPDHYQGRYGIPPDDYSGQAAAYRPGKRFFILILCFFICVNFIIFGLIVINHNYAFIGRGIGNTYIAKIHSTELDLGDSGLTEFDGIERMTELKKLDLRGLDITAAQYVEIKSLLPDDCIVNWNIPIGGMLFDSELTFVSFSDATVDELDSIRYFENLQSVNASGCRHYDKLKDLSLEFPSCDITWSIPFAGKEYPCTTTEMTVSGDVTSEQIEDLKLFPWLAYVDATEYNDLDALVNLSSVLPNCEILWKVKLAGISVKSTSSSIDISGTQITDLNSFKNNLAFLPKLKHIIMCDCGLSNSEMGELRDMFPDKKFVWIVSFGNKDIKTWKVRTDATIFSTLNPSGGMPFDQKDFEPLFLYCTDLVALDLGHNMITDISLISNLKQLKYLIIADNHISDISPLASLDKLEYLEMWLNNVSDASPLSGLENLYDIDLANNYISDLTPFYSMNQLLSLRLDDSLSKGSDLRNELTYSQLNKLASAIPQCRIERYHNDAYGYFKNNPRYLSMKMAFSNYSEVIYFKSWDDVKYSSTFYK